MVCDLEMKLFLVCVIFAPCLLVCLANGQSCANNTSSASTKHGRAFPGFGFNVTETALKTTTPHVYGCRHLCKHDNDCVAMNFLESEGVRPNCFLLDWRLGPPALSKQAASFVILFTQKHCQRVFDANAAHWSDWFDDPPCPDPCLKLNVIQKRKCLKPYEECEQEFCAGNEPERPRPCYPEECREVSTLREMTSTEYVYVNVSGRRTPVGITYKPEYGEVWLTIQKRVADVNFNHSWEEYRTGFGSLDQSFWIGNDLLHELTKDSPKKVYINVRNAAGNDGTGYASFQVASKDDGFRLSISDPKDPEFDSLTSHSNLRFSTFDMDNDDDSTQNCAAIYGGGWWFGNGCQIDSNLNGAMSSGPGGNPPPRYGIYWKQFDESGAAESRDSVELVLTLLGVKGDLFDPITAKDSLHGYLFLFPRYSTPHRAF